MKNYFLLLFPLLFLAACKNQPAENQATTPAQPESTTQSTAQGELPADFLEFYRRFHADSIYQVEHILWPLPGQTSDVVGDTTHTGQHDTHWQLRDWTMHHALDESSGDYAREFEMLGDMLLIERIRARGANYGLERRFAKQPDGTWQLIYYSDMHEMPK